ncbi:MAG: sugar transferase [Candidatus Omnitrophica bacterium]|nr:sugar transferase [Candidatus Omnitrophota bacterium]
MKRLFDLILSSVLLVVLIVPISIVVIVIKLSSRGPIIFWTDRVGANNAIFRMSKFRTMRLNTPQVATHLMKDPEIYLTPIGAFLRRYSIDEIPQLFNILRGEMSFVGPRPALFNQYDLIESRTKKNVHMFIPGVTGWAQINGRDNLSIPAKVAFDEYYLKNRSLLLDFKILLITVCKVIKKEGISH